MCDGEAQEVCCCEPVLVGEVIEFGTDDVHGGSGGGFVEVGSKVTKPQAGHDQEESQTGDNDCGLLILRGGVCLGVLETVSRGPG